MISRYFSTTNRIKDKPTEQQLALSLIKDENALSIIEKITYNVVVAPTEAKYRKIKLSNPKIKSAITDIPESMSYLTMLGWEQQSQDGETFLSLPDKMLSMSEVRDIQAAQREWQLKQRDMKRSASVASLKE